MIRSLLLSSALALGTGSAAGAAVIFADDFESDGLGLNAALNHWSVTAGSIDVIGSNYYEWYGPGRYLDMNGSTGQNGRIETGPLGLRAGAHYEIQFDYGNNANSNGRELLGFGIGGTYHEVAVNGHFPALVHYTFAFVAGQPSANLFFADVGDTPWDNGGPILDNVLVQTSSVPVPAAGILLACALGTLGLGRRRAL